MLSTVSCSKLSLLEDSVKKQRKAMKDFESKFFQALENKDAELLKSCFSERAVERAPDLDKGIAYVLDLYRDGKATISDDNQSCYSHYGENRDYTVMHCYCEFYAGENNYKVMWTDWLSNKADPSMVGVYSVELFEGTGNDKEYFDIAGIAYPEREFLDNSISTLFDYKGVQEDTYDIFSEDVLKNSSKVQLDALERFIDDNQSKSFDKMWISKEDGGYTAYADVRFALDYYVLGLKYNDDKKITAMSMGKDISSLDLDEPAITGISEIIDQ